MPDDIARLADLPPPRTRHDLRTRISPARAALEATLTRLSDAQRVAPGHERWSVKDHLAHIAAWERMIVAHLRNGSDHTIAGMSPTEYAAASLDELNERLYQRNREHALSEVLVEFHAAHAAIVAFIATLDERALARPYWDDDSSRRPVVEKIAGDTYLHYLEHGAWIEELIANTPPPARDGSTSD